jgi:arginase family enzyme
MKVIKAYPGAEDIINALRKYSSESGSGIFFEISSDTANIENSIVLRDENKFPSDYGLILISSKIDKKILNRKDIVILGLADYSRKDIKQLETNRVRSFTMKQITELGLEEAADLVMESAMQFGKLCLSINLDCLDRAFYPDGAIGGMTTRELIYTVQKIKLMKNLKTAEISGSDKDITAKLVSELS